MCGVLRTAALTVLLWGLAVPATAQYALDLTPPTAPVLNRPKEGAQKVKRTPTFEWTLADDMGGSGVARYELVLDGTVIQPPDLVCAEVCTTTLVNPLGRGEYRWFVRAIDAAGNVATSAEKTFRVNARPKAVLTVPDGLHLTGERLRFDAGGSLDAFGEKLVQFDWDLDGDGTFETNTRGRPRASKVYDEREDPVITVRVTDLAGFVAFDSAPVHVRLRPPAGPVGVTINDGASETEDPSVSLALVWPEFAAFAQIADNRRFARSRTRAVRPTVAWAFKRARHKRERRTIFVRFTGVDGAEQTYSDSIRLLKVGR
jgi:hypothetical protein